LEDLEDVSLPIDTTPFSDYVTTQWIEGDRNIWNHFDTAGPVTTNLLGVWQHAHPNIYIFIKVIQEIQTANEVNIIQRAAGGLAVPRRKRYRNIQDQLIQLKTRLQNGDIDIINYGDTVSYLLHLE